jgi:hypothetical protein
LVHEHADTYSGRHGPTDTGRRRAADERLARDRLQGIERGELRALHVGRQLRIDPADFASYLERANDAV